MNKNHTYKGILMLTLCAFIWGTAFIAQSIGGQYAEPLTFNCARSVLATIFLIGACTIFDKLAGKSGFLWFQRDKKYRHKLYKAGILCGLALSLATFFQQLGIMYTTVGKSGFITALYIVIVPLLGRFAFRSTVTVLQWVSVLVAAVGMYFICITEAFTVNQGDIYTLICAVCFSIQILCVEKYVDGLDGMQLSLIQFAICSISSGLLMFIFEAPAWKQITASLLPILYLGIMSSGIAYTLQIVGQKYVPSVLASMLMSLESVFALLSGWIILGQTMSVREIGGCALVFAAIILSQLPEKRV